MGLKKELAGRGLSIQETLEYFASLVVDDHPHAIKMLDNLEREKREKAVSHLQEKYTKNLYDVIGDDNPFHDNQITQEIE